MFTTNPILAHAALILIVAASIFNCTPLKASPADEKGKGFLSRLFKKPKLNHTSRDTGNSNPKFEKQSNERLNLNAMIREARDLETQDRLQLAVQKYKSVLAVDQNVAFAHHRLAVLLDKSGRSDEAQFHYLTAANLAPNNAEIFCDHGYSLYLQGRLEEAAQDYQVALRLDPNLKRAYSNLGMLYAVRGQTGVAMQHFLRAGCDRAQANSNIRFGASISRDVLAKAQGSVSDRVVSNSNQFAVNGPLNTQAYQAPNPQLISRTMRSPQVNQTPNQHRNSDAAYPATLNNSQIDVREREGSNSKLQSVNIHQTYPAPNVQPASKMSSPPEKPHRNVVAESAAPLNMQRHFFSENNHSSSTAHLPRILSIAQTDLAADEQPVSSNISSPPETQTPPKHRNFVTSALNEPLNKPHYPVHQRNYSISNAHLPSRLANAPTNSASASDGQPVSWNMNSPLANETPYQDRNVVTEAVEPLNAPQSVLERNYSNSNARRSNAQTHAASDWQTISGNTSSRRGNQTPHHYRNVATTVRKSGITMNFSSQPTAAKPATNK